MPHKDGHTIIPKNLGPTFRTRSGCECVKEFEYKNPNSDKSLLAKNQCVTAHVTEPWCRTKNNCGRKEKGKSTWDYCLKDRRSELLEGDTKFGKNYSKKNLLGIFIFIVLFVITIPILLYKFHFYEILEVYMPNFDLLATAVSFQDGALGNIYFQELYNEDSGNIIGWLSTFFINYLSLLGLTYLVARRVKLTKSLLKGWSIGFVMLIMTYLLPNIFITYIQNKLSDYIQGTFINPNTVNQIMGDPSKKTFWPFGIGNISVLFAGLSVAGLFILAEVFLLKHNKIWLVPFVKRLMLIDDAIDKW